MRPEIFWMLNFVAFVVLSFAINIKVTRITVRNRTWSPYGAPDLIAGFSLSVAIIIVAMWLVIFFSFVK